MVELFALKFRMEESGGKTWNLLRSNNTGDFVGST